MKQVMAVTQLMALKMKMMKNRKGLTMEYRKMTPRELFEILENLIKENGFDAVKDTVDSMWGLLKHLDGENDFVERD